MKTVLTTMIAGLAATTAYANPAAVPVPEISALEGTAAIAALVAIVLLAWERRRRRV